LTLLNRLMEAGAGRKRHDDAVETGKGWGVAVQGWIVAHEQGTGARVKADRAMFTLVVTLVTPRKRAGFSLTPQGHR
jgi:hypothetical protein